MRWQGIEPRRPDSGLADFTGRAYTRSGPQPMTPAVTFTSASYHQAEVPIQGTA